MHMQNHLMTIPAPTSIRRTPERTLQLKWESGEECALPLIALREECPCAHCKGETILGKTYMPVKLPMFVEGMNDLIAIEQVGSYAVRLRWGDGHDTGIYTWEYLRMLCGIGRE